MRALFLDDMSERHRQFKSKHSKEFEHVDYVYTYDDAVKYLKSHTYNAVFLDHELSENAIMCDPDDIDERTGADLAIWIVQNMETEDAPGFVIHSLNPVGRERMVNLLRDAGFDASGIPFYILCNPDIPLL